MRLGWFRPVHCKSMAAQEMRALLTARKLVQSKLLDVQMSLRGLLRGFGLKVGATTPSRFAGRIRVLVEGNATLEVIAAALLAVHETLRRERLVEVHQPSGTVMSCGSVESQYLVGVCFALWPLDQQPLFRSALGELVITMCDPDAHAKQSARTAHSAEPSRHLMVRHARLGSPRASCLTEIGRCLPSRRIASVVARGPITFWAAAAPCPTARPWCVGGCRRRSSIPAP